MSVPQLFAPEVAALAADGASVNAIAFALGLSWETVRAALDWSRDGDGPIDLVAPVRTAGEGFCETPVYVRIAGEVARRRDEGRQKFREIAEALDVSQGTVGRAYDWAHRADRAAAAAAGRVPAQFHIPHLGAAVHDEIVRLLTAGRRPEEVAAEVGSSKTTVYRARRALNGPPGPPPAERIAAEVARRRDEDGEGFATIAEDLDVCRRTVRRAYDRAHPEAAAAAAREGRAADRGRTPRLGAEAHREIDRLIRAGWAAPRIAAEVGCGEATVYLARKALKAPRPPSKFERIAAEVARRRDEGGEGFHEIAAALGVSRQTVRRAYDLTHPEAAAAAREGRAADRGRTPGLGAEAHREIDRLIRAGRTGPEIAAEVGCSESTVALARKALKGPSDPPKVGRIAAEVARRRDEGGETFAEIAAALKVSRQTVSRAYDRTHPEEPAAAAREGRRPDRGRTDGLGAAKHMEIVRLIRAGRTGLEIAAEVGCAESTVSLARKALKAAAPTPKAAPTADEDLEVATDPETTMSAE